MPKSERAQCYYRARYYDPQAGRFLGEDPIKFSGGENFYAYAFDNPTNLKDPSGKIVWIPVIVGVGGGVIGGIGEGTKGYRCGDRGWKLAGDIGRGALSGAAGALTGLFVATYTGNPWAGGAAGSAASDLTNGAFGGEFSWSGTAKNAAIGGIIGGVGAGAAEALLPVRGGSNFNPLTSPRTFGPKAVQFYAGEVNSHALELGKESGSDCGCK